MTSPMIIEPHSPDLSRAEWQMLCCGRSCVASRLCQRCGTSQSVSEVMKQVTLTHTHTTQHNTCTHTTQHNTHTHNTTPHSRALPHMIHRQHAVIHIPKLGRLVRPILAETLRLLASITDCQLNRVVLLPSCLAVFSLPPHTALLTKTAG